MLKSTEITPIENVFTQHENALHGLYTVGCLHLKAALEIILAPEPELCRLKFSCLIACC